MNGLLCSKISQSSEYINVAFLMSERRSIACGVFLSYLMIYFTLNHPNSTDKTVFKGSSTAYLGIDSSDQKWSGEETGKEQKAIKVH